MSQELFQKLGIIAVSQIKTPAHVELPFELGKKGHINKWFCMLVLGVAVCTLTFAAILFALSNTSVPCQVAFFPNPSLHNPYSAAILSEAKEQTVYFIVS